MAFYAGNRNKLSLTSSYSEHNPIKRQIFPPKHGAKSHQRSSIWLTWTNGHCIIQRSNWLMTTKIRNKTHNEGGKNLHPNLYPVIIGGGSGCFIQALNWQMSSKIKHKNYNWSDHLINILTYHMYRIIHDIDGRLNFDQSGATVEWKEGY